MNCYGTFNDGKNDCQECLWGESCRYMTQEPKELYPLGRKMVSLEKVYNIPVRENVLEKENLVITIDELADFFRWLLQADTYTLGLLREVILTNGATTVSELARLHGCSRWAMHRKILSVISKDKKLAPLFISVMPKISESRKKFLRKQ